jgi:hypothetical protein
MRVTVKWRAHVGIRGVSGFFWQCYGNGLIPKDRAVFLLGRAQGYRGLIRCDESKKKAEH